MPSCLVARHHILRTILSPKDLTSTSEFSIAHDAWRTKKSSRSFRRRNASSYTRAYSSSTTSTEASNGSPKKEASSSNHKSEVSALLHRISAFLPRALSGTTNDGGIQSAQLWSELLSEIDEDLSISRSSTVRSARRRGTGSHELITALLENPFTTDEAYSDILRNRWKNQSAFLTIECILKKHSVTGPSTSLVNDALTIPSSWLQQYPFPIQLTEIPSLASHPSLPKTLLKADVLILLCNPLTTPLPTLISKAHFVLQRPRTILLLTGSGSGSEHVLEHVTKELGAAGCAPGKVIAVDPIRALEAVSAFKKDPSCPAAIQKYQDDFTGSRVSLLGEVLAGMLGFKESGRASTTSTSPSSLLSDICTRSALMQMHGALHASAQSVSQARIAIDRVFTSASELQSQVEQVRARADKEVLLESGIDEALLRGSKEMKALLESLTWLKMMWRVDEIDVLVGSALERYWCRELENQLILQTGHLASTQASLTSSTFSQLTKLASPSQSPHCIPTFNSPILSNNLHQLTHSPTYTLTPSTLTYPIQARRSQLTKHTTTRLHREAQNAVLGAFGGFFGGAGLGWWLAFGESVLSVGVGAGSEAGTAVGAGAFVAVAGVRWAVGKWEKAKRRWLEDVERVGEGLKRDLKVTLQQGIEKNVAVVPIAAYQGLRKLAGKQQEEMEVVRSDLMSMQADVEALETGRAS
ncbi:uncharacterized protein EDB91DRAFT_1305688 [Suillus paluster]|uniref:uncharacterized protein n=1 Tax=Suillus paluster TaxID=48578 RepID=UPI001B877059|nr:uncharacterized protein EDB91DRAFT_1305688 [Suillus paluster]KAG1731473.1 hypothetical protein EDB91DRAFT_1305688 [Suillus paluster]